MDVTATHSWQVAATLFGKNKIAMLEVTQHSVTVKVSKVHAQSYLCKHTPFTFKHTYTNIYYFIFLSTHIYNNITLHTTPHHPPICSLKSYNQGTIACCFFRYMMTLLNDNILTNNPTHPLHSCYEILPSGKRYRTPAFKRQLYNKSFIPSAVGFLNSQKIL